MDEIARFIQTSGEFDWYSYVILPLIIFVGRAVDVTLGTLRIMYVARGKRNLAPFFGFFEVLIWIVIIGQIVQNIDQPAAYFAYAAGFAAGNYLGILIEGRLAVGTLLIRVIIPGEAGELPARLREAGFGVTIVNGLGASGPVQLVYTIVRRKNYAIAHAIIQEWAPRAFISIEEERSIEKGIFPIFSRGEITGAYGRKIK